MGKNEDSIEKLLDLNEYTVVSIFFQRVGRGGRPLVIANNTKYIVENLTNTVVDIPWGIEAV